MDRELQDMALDMVAEIFKSAPELRTHAEDGIRIVKRSMPWATDQQAADILRYVGDNFSAVISASNDGRIDLAESLRRAEINTITAAGFAQARAAGKI